MGPAKVAFTDAAHQTRLRPNIAQIVVGVGIDVGVGDIFLIIRIAIKVVDVVIFSECRCERPALPSHRAIIRVGIGTAAATRRFNGRISCVCDGRRGANCVD